MIGWFGKNSPQHGVSVDINRTGECDALYCWEETEDFSTVQIEHWEKEIQMQSDEMSMNIAFQIQQSLTFL